ncbi:MAG: peptide chain release factor N(5)-glutamine methyltransferase [Mycoplasmataceae bacterium]|nr:peptide chain release factor N(5)-glutamine methyltransferase [Mycoplasmataceae bacterium]
MPYFMKELLLREKRRYGLPEEVSNEEMKLLQKGTPIQKIMGFISFNKITINVNRDVLIPRYETEEVVNEALKYLSKESRALDLCTGSGFIGLTIKDEKDCDVVLSDISDEAIIQSKENAKLNNLDVEIIKSDMFENIEGKFDLIISNPPYIPNYIVLGKEVLDFEPANALFAGRDGNDFYKVIFKNLDKYLADDGTLVLEISEDNVEYIKSMGCEILNDINEKPRIAIFRKRNHEKI